MRENKMRDNSRSIQRRKAAMRGEPAPEFDKKELKLLSPEQRKETIGVLVNQPLAQYEVTGSDIAELLQAQAELTARETFKNVSAFDVDSEGRAVIRMPLEDWQALRKQTEGER